MSTSFFTNTGGSAAARNTITADLTASNNAKSDAQKYANNPEDAQFTLSDSVTTGFSALHYNAKAGASATAAASSASAASSSASTANQAKLDAQAAKADIVSLSDTYVTLADAQTVAGAKIFTPGATFGAAAATNVYGLSITTSSTQSDLSISGSGSSNEHRVKFFNSNGQVGAINTSGTATSYVTSSDYRLKENVSYTWDATTRLKQLKPARFNFIADSNTTVDGFLAHEVSSVVPEAISGEKDAVDSDSNPIYQGIDQSKLVPLLVKTIQELEARITALES